MLDQFNRLITRKAFLEQYKKKLFENGLEKFDDAAKYVVVFLLIHILIYLLRLRIGLPWGAFWDLRKSWIHHICTLPRPRWWYVVANITDTECCRTYCCAIKLRAEPRERNLILKQAAWSSIIAHTLLENILDTWVMHCIGVPHKRFGTWNNQR